MRGHGFAGFRFGRFRGFSSSGGGIALSPQDKLFTAQLALGPKLLYKGYDFDGTVLVDSSSTGKNIDRKTFTGGAPSGSPPYVAAYGSSGMNYLTTVNYNNAFCNFESLTFINDLSLGYSWEMIIFEWDAPTNVMKNINHVNKASNKQINGEVDCLANLDRLDIITSHYSGGSSALYTSTNSYIPKVSYCAMTWNPSDGKFRHYINGSLVGTSTVFGAPDIQAGGIFMNYPSTYKSGSSNIAFYTKCLTPTEISNNYSAIGVDLTTL